MYELKVIGRILFFFGAVSAIIAILGALLMMGIYYREEHCLKDCQQLFGKIFPFFIALGGIIVLIPGTIAGPFLSKIIASIIMIIAGVIYYNNSLWAGTLKLLIIFDAVVFLIGMVIVFGNIFSWLITPIVDTLFPTFFLSHIGSMVGKIVLSFSWRQIVFGIFACTLPFCAILYLRTKIPKS